MPGVHSLKASVGPLYLTIAQLMRGRIAAGQWRPGAQLPTLNALIREFGASRMTVRQAVSVLEDEGLVWRRQGKGTFVADKSHPPRIALDPDWGAMVARLEKALPEPLKVIEAVTDAGLRPDDGAPAPVYRYMRRLHRVDGVPYAVIDLWLDRRCYDRAPHEFDRRMVIPLIEKAGGVRVRRSRQTLRIGTADLTVAALLDIPVNAPVGVVRHVLQDDQGTVVYVGEVIYRGDLVSLETVIER
jgi:GntR family transcriptional regulator